MPTLETHLQTARKLAGELAPKTGYAEGDLQTVIYSMLVHQCSVDQVRDRIDRALETDRLAMAMRGGRKLGHAALLSMECDVRQTHQQNKVGKAGQEAWNAAKEAARLGALL